VPPKSKSDGPTEVDRDRFIDFDRDRAQALATRTVRFAGGVALFRDDLPFSYDRNALLVDLDADAEAAALASAADRLQGGAGLAHRKVVVHGSLGTRLAEEFRALGWQVVELVVRLHDGRMLDVFEPAEEVGPTQAETFWVEGIRREHGADSELIRQLVAARHARREATPVRYFAARAPDGRIVSACELFSDGRTAQVETVETLEEYRGLGLARAIVSTAVSAAQAAAHEHVYIVADAAGWPGGWYQRLGFEPVGSIFEFVRPLA